VLFLEIAGVLSAVTGIGLWFMWNANLGALMLVISAVFLTGRVIAGEIRHLRDDLKKATTRDEEIQEDGIENVHRRDTVTRALQVPPRKRELIAGFVFAGVVVLLLFVMWLFRYEEG
jgi:hypothetical protein